MPEAREKTQKTAVSLEAVHSKESNDDVRRTDKPLSQPTRQPTSKQPIKRRTEHTPPPPPH